MSERHQIFVYRCSNCGNKKKTMDPKDYLESKMKDNPGTFACCEKPDLKQVDQYFR